MPTVEFLAESVFGLPSLPGLQSDCEEEILLLMKEIDFEFQRKYRDLIGDRMRLHSLSQAQRDEIENLRRILMSNNETSQDNRLKELVKEYSTQIEQLKKENNELKTENHFLQRRIQKFPENEIQLNSLKRSLDMQQDENRILKERLTKFDEQFRSLENNYQKVVNALAAWRQNRDNSNQNKSDEDSPSNFIEFQIVQNKEKFMSEEAEFGNDFEFKINQEIDNLERRLRNEII